MNTALFKFQNFLEKLDSYRDEILFIFIKPFWPRPITPNHLSWLRVVISIILFIFLFFLGIEDKLIIISLFIIGAITDMFDGSVARKLNEVTEFGAMLDPIADRMLILPIAFYSLLENQKWLLLALFLAEVINGFYSLYYKSKQVYLESNIYGRIKMLIQSIVFIAILFEWPNSPNQFFFYALWISLFFSLLSIFARLLELRNKMPVKKLYV